MTIRDVRSFVRSLVPSIPSDAWPKICALGVFVVALWAQTDAMVGAFYDDGIYVTLAKALAEGRGYYNIHLPDAPPAVHYPPLYPFVLSLLWRLWPAFPENVVLFQLADCAALAGAAWIIAVQAGKWSASPLVRLAVAVAFTAFPVLAVVGVRFSEPFFLLLFAAAVALADRDRPTLRTTVAAGGLAGLAALTRSIGVAVIAGVVVGLWLRGGRKTAVLAGLVGALVSAPWGLWVVTHAHAVDPRLAANYGTYFDETQQAGLGGILTGINWHVFEPVARLVLPSSPPWLWYPLAVALSGLIIWVAARAASRAPALVASLAGYVVIVALWPYAPDRFIWIILPWLAVFVVLGLESAADYRPWPRVAAVAIAAVLILGYAPREVRSLASRGFANAALGTSVPARFLAPAIAQGTPADAIVAAESEATIYLYAGRRVVPSFLFRWKGRSFERAGPDSTLGFYCASGVTLVTLSSPLAEAAPPILALAARADSTLTPIVTVTSGPTVYRLRCPR